MEPCFVNTYYQEGPCAVDINAINKYEDEQEGDFNKCRLYFNDGTELRLEESCEDFQVKRQQCRTSPPTDLPVFPK